MTLDEIRGMSEAAMKGRTVEGFGARLERIRKSRGMTQAELAERVGVSRRVIAYYESEQAQPPGAMLVDLARALRVSADELLGLKQLKVNGHQPRRRILKRVEQIEHLPATQQRALLKTIDAFVRSNANGGRG